MMRSGNLGVIIVSLIVLALLLACGNQETPTPRPGAPPAAGGPTGQPAGVPTTGGAQPAAAPAATPPPPPPAKAGEPPRVAVELPPSPPGQPGAKAPPAAPVAPDRTGAPLVVAPPPEPAARDAQQASSRLVSTQNPFVQLVPEAARARGPDWLREGTRLTYDVKSANIPRDRDETGTGGAGVIQVDVVGIDNLNVACSVKLYLDTDLRATYHPNLVADSYNLAGAGKYWVQPALLKDIEKVAKDELKMTRIPAKIGERSYNSVRFEYTKGAAKYVWLLDEASGVLLFHSAVQGTDETARQASTVVTLVGVRQVRLPWNARAVPGWVTRGTVIPYNGRVTFAPFGTYPQSLPLGFQAEVKEVSPRWVQYTFKDMGPIPSLPSYRVTGVSQIFDGMWLPGEALQSLKHNDLVDTDPVTGSKTTVTRGGGGLTLTESGRAYRTEATYDERTGAQVAVRQETTSVVLVTTIELQRSQR